MSSNSNGVAILGAGIFANIAHLPALVALANNAAPLKAVYSRSEATASKFAATAISALNLSSLDVYHDGDTSKNLDALLARSDISSVIIVLPIPLQPSIILKSLAAGKHVISEKPIAKDVSAATSLIATYVKEFKPKGLIWRVAENFEAEPAYRAAKKAVEEGKIGKVAFFEATVINFVDKDSMWYKTPWRTVPDYQGGFILDGGVHTIAALRTILPSPITHVSGFASLTRSFLAPHDTITTIAKSSTGSYTGTLNMSWASPTKTTPSQGIVITGTTGYLSIDLDRSSGKPILRLKITTKSNEDEGEDGVEVVEEPMRGVEKELESFFRAVKGEDDGLGDLYGALEDVKYIQAALTSEGALIDLREMA